METALDRSDVWMMETDDMTSQRDALIQMVQQNDEKHEESHRRLRQDLDRLEDNVNKGLESLRILTAANLAKIEANAQLPIDATKLILRTPVVVSIVIFVVITVGAVWGIRSSNERLADRVEATARLQEEQITAIKADVKEVKQRQELKQYDVQELKDMIINGQIKIRQ